MDIGNMTLINTASFTAGVREVIIGVITSVIVLVIGYLLIERRREANRIKRDEKNKRREELKDYIHQHHRDLIDNVLKLWYKQDIDESGKFVSLKTEHLAIEHLKTGYPDTYGKMWIKQNNLKFQITEDRKQIKKSIINNFDGLPPYFELEFPKPNGKRRIIYELLEEFYQNAELPEEGKIKDSKIFVDEIIKDKSLCARFEDLNKNRTYYYKINFELEQGLEKIVNDFDNWGNELEGVCDECKSKYEELKTLNK